MTRHRSNSSRRAVNPSVEIAILAGGLSKRMGRDKSKVRLGRRTLLGHVKAVALATGWPVRVIRHDVVPRCGPVGGIYTALKTARAEAIVFLACDMPFVTPELLTRLVRNLRPAHDGVVYSHGGTHGFPILLRREALKMVQAQIDQSHFSLQSLVASLKVNKLKILTHKSEQLFNLNTPTDAKAAGARFRSNLTAPGKTGGGDSSRFRKASVTFRERGV